MRLRNGEHGYGLVTRTLHWGTVALLAAQFSVGYLMDADGDAARIDCDPPGERRGGGGTTDAEEDRLDRLEERCEAREEAREEDAEDALGSAWSDLWHGDLADGGLSLPETHVLLGLLVLAVALLRLAWRALTPLPPWAPALSATGRRLLHASELALLGTLVALPLSGLLPALGSDDLVVVHVCVHVAFLVALLAHLAVVLRWRLLPRMLIGRS